MCANFQPKRTTLNFVAQMSPKIDFGLEIQKTSFGIRISILEKLCVPIFNFDFFGPNLPKNGFWGQNFENLCPGSESAPPRYHVCQVSSKTDNFDFFTPNLPKNEFWGQNIKILSPDLESAAQI